MGPYFSVFSQILFKYNCHNSTLSLLSLFRLNPFSIIYLLVRSSKIRYFCFAFLRLILVKKEMKERRKEKRNCKKPKIYDIFSLVVQSSEFSTEKSDSSSHKQRLFLLFPFPMITGIGIPQVCYGPDYGCFDQFPPFANPLMKLPQSPEEIGTSFRLYTRDNNITNEADELDDSDKEKLKKSHFNIERPKTIIVCHGWTGT